MSVSRKFASCFIRWLAPKWSYGLRTKLVSFLINLYLAIFQVFPLQYQKQGPSSLWLSDNWTQFIQHILLSTWKVPGTCYTQGIRCDQDKCFLPLMKHTLIWKMDNKKYAASLQRLSHPQPIQWPFLTCFWRGRVHLWELCKPGSLLLARN